MPHLVECSSLPVTEVNAVTFGCFFLGDSSVWRFWKLASFFVGWPFLNKLSLMTLTLAMTGAMTVARIGVVEALTAMGSISVYRRLSWRSQSSDGCLRRIEVFLGFHSLDLHLSIVCETPWLGHDLVMHSMLTLSLWTASILCFCMYVHRATKYSTQLEDRLTTSTATRRESPNTRKTKPGNSI